MIVVTKKREAIYDGFGNENTSCNYSQEVFKFELIEYQFNQGFSWCTDWLDTIVQFTRINP